MRLLNRTVTNYLLYSALLVLLCTPAFYFAIQHLFVRAMDEELASHKADFLEHARHLKSPEDFRFYTLLNNETKIIPVHKLRYRDSVYTDVSYDSSLRHEVPHRVLVSGVAINDLPYDLVVSESMVSNTSLIGAIMSVQILLLLLLMVGLYFVNKNLARSVWTPFYQILDKLKRYRIDRDETIELPFAATAEFRELSTAIRSLVNRNHAVYLSQKEFTENAAHELQTPLAISRSKLELLAQTSELTQEQAELVGHVLDATDRLSRLNKNLLLLAKIENRYFQHAEELDVQLLVSSCLPMYQRQATERQLTLHADLQKTKVLSVQRSLMEVLISNLLSNAVRYALPGGMVIVNCVADKFEVKNSGAPMQHPEKIFQRFYRDTRTGQGSGLGLAIVKKICDVEGFDINYQYQDNMHTFTVRF